MAPLFSKIDSNKLWYGVQNEETVIYAKFGKDQFNIYKVIGHKTKCPGFLAYPVSYRIVISATYFYTAEN